MGYTAFKGVVFDQYYSPMTHYDSFIINIAIAYIHIITARVLYISNDFYNKNVPINERVFVIPPPYYLYWFEKYYPNVIINK